MAAIPEKYVNSAASLLFKVKKTQVEMMRDRGYDVSNDIAILGYTITDFIDVYNDIITKKGGKSDEFKSALSDFYTKENGETIYVHYPETMKDAKKLSKSQIISLVDYIKQYPTIRNIMIISELPLSDDAQKELLKLPAYTFDRFLYEELAYNPTKHYLVPRHVLLLREEAIKFRRDNKLKFNQLPLLSIHDPIARYYGFRHGQTIRIHRENLAFESLVDEYISYRAVRDVPLERDK